LGDSKVFPGQPGDVIPPACPGSSPGPLPSLTGRPPYGDDQRASLLGARTTSTDSFRCTGAAALLRVPPRCLSFSTVPVPESEPRHPTEEPYFLLLVSMILSFQSLPKVHDHR
ncbi:hypothetical protein LDENG_00224340, partial [Lucifuga dentata]